MAVQGLRNGLEQEMRALVRDATQAQLAQAAEQVDLDLTIEGEEEVTSNGLTNEQCARLTELLRAATVAQINSAFELIGAEILWTSSEEESDDEDEIEEESINSGEDTDPDSQPPNRPSHRARQPSSHSAHHSPSPQAQSSSSPQSQPSSHTVVPPLTPRPRPRRATPPSQPYEQDPERSPGPRPRPRRDAPQDPTFPLSRSQALAMSIVPVCPEGVYFMEYFIMKVFERLGGTCDRFGNLDGDVNMAHRLIDEFPVEFQAYISSFIHSMFPDASRHAPYTYRRGVMRQPQPQAPKPVRLSSTVGLT